MNTGDVVVDYRARRHEPRTMIAAMSGLAATPFASRLEMNNTRKGFAMANTQQSDHRARLDKLINRVNTLVAQQRKIVASAKTSGDTEAAKAANDATKATKVAAVATRAAKDDPHNSDKAAAAAQAVEKARASQAAAFEKLEGRVKALEGQVVSLGAKIDQSVSASAEALAVVQAASSGRRAPIWLVGFVVLAVALVGWGLADIFKEVNYFWDAVWGSVVVAIFVMAVTAILDAYERRGGAVDAFGKGRAEARATAETRRHGEADNDQTEYASAGRR